MYEGTFVTWNFGHQCWQLGTSLDIRDILGLRGHLWPGTLATSVLRGTSQDILGYSEAVYYTFYNYVGQLGKSMAVLDLQSHLCRDSLFVLVALFAQYRVNVDDA